MAIDNTQYLIEIHEKVARIDATVQALSAQVRDHRSESQAGNRILWGEVEDLRDDLNSIRTDVAEAKGAVRGVKWLGAAVAATVALIVKFVSSLWP